MQNFPDDWNLRDKIEFLQRKIILNSIAYYNYDTNFLTDQEFDSISRQLVELHNEYGDISSTQYGYAFKDFDGSTGFDLVYLLTNPDSVYLTNMVKQQIRRTGGDRGGSTKRRK